MNRNTMESVLNVAADVFGLSSEKRAQLACAIRENHDLSSLLASGEIVSPGREKSVSKDLVSGRCEALVWMLERDASGMWIPKRCTRGCVEGGFCKNHGARVSKRCDDCSSFQGCEVVHEFKHEHLGTIGGRSFVIDKFWDVLVKKSEAACCVEDSSSSEVEVLPKKAKNVVSVPVLPSSEKKPSRVVDNPFMNWLSAHRAEIKSVLLSEGTVSGRELTTLVSKRGGEMWRALSKDAQQEWKGKKLVSSEIVNDGFPSDDTVSSVVVDEDETTLVFNKEHSVWVDADTGLYYGSEDIESAPLGQLSGGKLVAFKKASSKK
jgi:hypothetical protein